MHTTRVVYEVSEHAPASALIFDSSALSAAEVSALSDDTTPQIAAVHPHRIV
jgi:hypothetical protein